MPATATPWTSPGHSPDHSPDHSQRKRPVLLFLQTTINGLVLGGIYSLAAVGFSLIFGVIGIVNLTHGIFVIAGAYMAMALFAAAGIDPLLAIPFIGAVLFAVGYAYQRTIIDWAISRASVEASLVVTFGMAMVFRNLLQLWFGPDVQTITPSYSFDSVAIGPIRVDMVRLAALGASMALLTGLTLMLARTHFGRAMRAVAQQPLAASLSGLNVRRIHGLTFGVSAALAGASGAIIGIVQPFSASSEVAWTLNAFIVVVLGGIGSPAGALAGGLVLGLINAYTATYVSPALTQAMMFLVLVLMLLLRPQGILGAAYGESR
ncbi:MAG: branched-chain amino acid ABC transporter permease [Rhodobacteraceae bacterium]|nr:branched-chain amino acid ABC transporter permease [Paracoccaceae bacterium]MBR25364.1 branched-chain amino acid ABC transporter permease [Paracoccaceae bacterium]